MFNIKKPRLYSRAIQVPGGSAQVSRTVASNFALHSSFETRKKISQNTKYSIAYEIKQEK